MSMDDGRMNKQKVLDPHDIEPFLIGLLLLKYLNEKFDLKNEF